MGFSQNEEDLQCSKKNDFEEVMQNFERKEEGENKENRFIRLYTSTWSLVGKYKLLFCLRQSSSSTEAAGPALSLVKSRAGATSS